MLSKHDVKKEFGLFRNYVGSMVFLALQNKISHNLIDVALHDFMYYPANKAKEAVKASPDIV